MKKLFIILLAGFATASAAHAEGTYIGASTARVGYDFDITTATSTMRIEDKVRMFKLFGGLELDKTWGIEGGYVDFGNSSQQYTLGGTAGNINTDGKAWYAAGKGRYTFNDDWSAFGKLGLAHTRTSFSSTGVFTGSDKASKTGLYLGAGVQYQLTKQVGLMLEVERYGRNAVDHSQAKVQNATSFSVGAKYSF